MEVIEEQTNKDYVDKNLYDVQIDYLTSIRN